MTTNTGDGADYGPEATALRLLEAAEVQQEKVDGLLKRAEDQQLAFVSAARQMALQTAEYGKLVVAIEKGYVSGEERVNTTIGQLEEKVRGMEPVVSAYVEAALDRHQEVIGDALKKAAEDAAVQVTETTGEAATATLQKLEQAALTADAAHGRIQKGLRDFSLRSLAVFLLVFLGGLVTAVGIYYVAQRALGDEKRQAERFQLEGELAALRREREILRPEVEELRKLRSTLGSRQK